MRSLTSRVGVAGICLVLVGLACAGSAAAEEPWWGLQANFQPSRLTPGGRGLLVITASDLGNAGINGEVSPVTLSDVLPTGVKAIGIKTFLLPEPYGVAGQNFDRGLLVCSIEISGKRVSCPWSLTLGSLDSYESMEAGIEIETEPGAAGDGQENEVTVSGGVGELCHAARQGTGKYSGPACGATEAVETGGDFEAEVDGQEVPSASRRQSVPVEATGGSTTPFGIEDDELKAENEGGASATQAGSHSFQVTSTLAFNQDALVSEPPALMKDVHVTLPAGFAGDVAAIPQCTEAEFDTILGNQTNLCPPDTAIGVVAVSLGFHHTQYPPTAGYIPLFNLVPAPGEPARFGFNSSHVTVAIDASVRTGTDYGINLDVSQISQLANVAYTRITIWGTPQDPSHDKSRGWTCLAGAALAAGGENAPCQPLGAVRPHPYLTLPTACTGPMESTAQATSWPFGEPKHQAVSEVVTASMAALTGCEDIPFGVGMDFEPEATTASTPTGATVKVKVPQEASLNPGGVAVSAIKDTTVVLPQGLTLNPAGANGLEACTEAEMGFEKQDPVTGMNLFTSTLGNPSCPKASKVGTVTIKSPDLANPLGGSVYVAAQNENPFGSLFALYVVADDPVSGVLVKLAGKLTLDETTGQMRATFENTPDAPIEELEMHFFGGDDATLATPSKCGTYTTAASFTPWSGGEPVVASPEFAITAGPHGGACPGTLPFAPHVTSGTTSNRAGAYSDFTTTISREDGEQAIEGVSLRTPPGFSGMLKGVALCPEAQANAGTCGPESLIGHTSASVGVGNAPYTVTGGQVFLTGGYEGAPFGLSITVPAKAGPFDLERGTPCDCFVVRAKVEVNRFTGQLTVASDPLPHILKGVVLEVKQIHVTVDRPNFSFNPTDCKQLSIAATLTAVEGGSSSQSVPFQAVNCATLKFAPKLTVSTDGRTSKAKGASLTFKMTNPAAPWGTLANLAKVKVDLPIQLPSRDSTLKHACLAAVFEANPANCPPGSIVGHATANVPILPVPLTGPAYFVSHGGEAFPSLTMMLQGYGITAELVGTTLIRKGVTSNTFAAVPDIPFTSFELNLPEGKNSALAAYGNLCKAKLAMPTALVAQNGLEIHQSTPIKATGCRKSKPPHKHTAKKRA